MNDQEFFNLLNQYPLRDENAQTSHQQQQSQPQSQPNIFSMLNSFMGGMRSPSTPASPSTTTTTTTTTTDNDIFWIKFREFLEKNISDKEKVNQVYNNFKLSQQKSV
ncbi:hypothetical protein CYY_007718 [Polysphondylium violaceum]|uniref:Uncharacterized protein n=1 Tax=Polysphondylium violaceum TaxID=133409 RepID=A0A8J4PNX6_9MYCE|nr:hypothetical protein CYY_007718 [Polysphondylium violaceum]